MDFPKQRREIVEHGKTAELRTYHLRQGAWMLASCVYLPRIQAENLLKQVEAPHPHGRNHHHTWRTYARYITQKTIKEVRENLREAAWARRLWRIGWTHVLFQEKLLSREIKPLAVRHRWKHLELLSAERRDEPCQ